MFHDDFGIFPRDICPFKINSKFKFDYKTKEINAKALKELVGTVRRMESIIPSFVDILFEQLRQTDCDVRLCVLHISGYFFQRSHRFRIELINEIQVYYFYYKKIKF